MINEFKGPTKWLSNFEQAPITYHGFYVPTNEHAFQMAKTMEVLEQQAIVFAATPGQAKRLGRTCTRRSDWEKVKDDVMLEITILKFIMHEDLRRKLLATGTEGLVEGNTWGDRYWGVDLETGFGRNQLGKTIMKVREMLR